MGTSKQERKRPYLSVALWGKDLICCVVKWRFTPMLSVNLNIPANVILTVWLLWFHFYLSVVLAVVSVRVRAVWTCICLSCIYTTPTKHIHFLRMVCSLPLNHFVLEFFIFLSSLTLNSFISPYFLMCSNLFTLVKTLAAEFCTVCSRSTVSLFRCI